MDWFRHSKLHHSLPIYPGAHIDLIHGLLPVSRYINNDTNCDTCHIETIYRCFITSMAGADSILGGSHLFNRVAEIFTTYYQCKEIH